MSRIIMLIPVSTSAGLTSVSLGVIRAMERKGMRLSLFKAIAQAGAGTDNVDHTTAIIRQTSAIPTADPLPLSDAETLLGRGQQDVLMEEIITRFHANTHDADVVLVEGLIPVESHQFINQLNYQIARTLNAEILLVMSPGNEPISQLKEKIELLQTHFGGSGNKNITGIIVNKLNAPVDSQGRTRPDLSALFDDNLPPPQTQHSAQQISQASPLPIMGCIPWNVELIATRAIDMCQHLQAEVINQGEITTRRIKSVTFCARSLPNMLDLFKPGALLVTSADRPDVLVAACLAAMNGIEIGAILLTGGYSIDPSIHHLCERAFNTGLPVFRVNSNTWQTSLQLQRFSLDIPVDDCSRIEQVQEYVAGFIDQHWVDSLRSASVRDTLMSPPAFRYQLTELARRANRTIVLPEGEEPRTIKAAAICAKKSIAKCILLGDPDEIKRIAQLQSVQLGDGVQIIDPATVREQYVERLVTLRKNKGMTEVVAREQLEDNVVLGTLMLEQDQVDGLVSGAIHTTANTIRPPLQIIKTAPDSRLVSSVFFMLLPEQVLVYGDCAINPDPDAEQLAEIAIQSADSAKAFGIEPRVAMISYSTGNSGAGSDVEKVRQATQIAQQKRPDLIIDGPLQYDAAIMEDVARSKAPGSLVAGRATVFIFPDLNTGNTTYKAVQRSANLISIGPMLQGMRKPVNDLSRGALVDDIVYTIALTAIQAEQAENKKSHRSLG